MEQDTLHKKIAAYKKSQGMNTWDTKSISRECRRLEKEFSIDRVEPRQYKILQKIASEVKLGDKIDLEAIARWAGYPDWMAKRVETTILRNIDPILFTKIVGINRNEVEMELVKVMKQDENLSAKNKALDLASRIVGMNEGDKGVQVNIVNDGITVAD